MSGLEKLIRPIRLFYRCPDLARVVDQVPAHQFQFALELLANQKLAADPVERRDAMLKASLENPLGAVIGETTAAVNVFCARNQYFILSSSVVAELARTSPGDVRIGDVKLPYEAIYIGFEHPIQVFEGLLCEGAFLWQFEGESLWLRVALTTDRTLWSDWLPDPGITFELGHADAVIENAIAAFCGRLRQYSDDAAKDGFAHMANEWRTLKEGREVLESKPTSERIIDFLADHGYDFARCVAIIMGAACLLTALLDEMVKPNVIWPRPMQTRPGTSHKTIKGAQPVRFISFGKSETSGHSSGEGVSPRAHLRRGHWRRQPFGPASDRAYRPKWIRPTLVNPDHGPLAEASVYQVTK
jgi:hypothetical protein